MALDTTRTIGLGAVVKFDTAGGTSWTTPGLITKYKPMGSELEMVDSTVLADTREHFQGGIQKATEIAFTSLWANSATTFATLNTACAAKSNVAWQFVTPHGTPQTHTTKGIIKSIMPTEVSNKEAMAFDVVIVTTETMTIT